MAWAHRGIATQEVELQGKDGKEGGGHGSLFKGKMENTGKLRNPVFF